MNNNTRPAVILFDVNETLLDMRPLRKKINNLLDSKYGFRIWFGMLLHYSLVDNSAKEYHDFASIANATLDMVSKALGKEIDEKEKKKALVLIRKLSAYSDVEKGLKLLKDAGYRLATLSNSPSQTLIVQLEYAGINNYFEAMLSIDAIKKYKPSLETYQYAAQTLGVNTNQVLMVAAHGWDIAGALQAGMKAAFVERKGQSLYPLSPTPQYIGKDLVEIAKAIIKHQ
jgi:2-haloacid dehalogenase